MFRCERCGGSFTPKEAKGLEGCPACHERDGVRSPLAFKHFSAAGMTPSALARCRRAARGLGGTRAVGAERRRRVD
jgi:hypothetical protein